MKICILNVLHGPFDKRMFHKVGMSLVAAGHEVVSICPRGDFEGAERDGVQFRYIAPSGSKVARLRAPLRAHLREVRQRFPPPRRILRLRVA